MPEIRGLSLSRPWPMAFLQGPVQKRKRVENRSWPPPRWMFGQYLALHVAQSWDGSGVDDILDILGVEVPRKKDYPSGLIVAVCQLTGCMKDDEWLDPVHRPWFCGPFGWVVSNVVELQTPILHKGALGLWKIAPSIGERILKEAYEI